MNFKQFLEEDSIMDKGIKQHLLSLGYEYLGKGADQSAYLEPGTGKVLKIFGTQELNSKKTTSGFSKDHLMFKVWAEYCEKNKDNKFLPRFDGWESFNFKGNKYLQIRMERLTKLPKSLAQTLWKISDRLQSTNNESIIDDIVDNIHNLDNSKIRFKDNEIDTLEQLAVLLGEKDFRLLLTTISNLYILSYKHSFYFDLHGNNFMHRNDGIPVIVDPWVV